MLVPFRSLLLLLLATKAYSELAVVSVIENGAAPGNSMVFTGEAITDDDKTFAYHSDWRDNKQIIKFELISEDVGDYEYTAFRLDALKNGQTIIEVVDADGNVERMKMKPDKEPPLSEEESAILKDLAMKDLGKMFVDTSRMMGETYGLVGTDSPAILSFHRMALWMAKVNLRRRKLELEEAPWEEEQGKEPTDFERDVANVVGAHHRELWCSKKDCCGNECFGMCGADCSCWSWICGTCGCVDECMEHDHYCSCHGMYHFWCINVFWVGCSSSWYQQNWCSH